MPRAVDPRRTAKALRAIERIAQEQGLEALSPWEREFLGEVGARLEKYGSAFADYAKGAPEEALSRLQSLKLREISGKAAKRPAEGAPAAPPRRGPGLQRKTPLRARRQAKPPAPEE